jgi:hypothetical protein
MRPGGELSDVLDRLGLHGGELAAVRDLLCFVAGRDPETFARAVGYAAPDALPERLRGAARHEGLRS